MLVTPLPRGDRRGKKKKKSCLWPITFLLLNFYDVSNFVTVTSERQKKLNKYTKDLPTSAHI